MAVPQPGQPAQEAGPVDLLVEHEEPRPAQAVQPGALGADEMQVALPDDAAHRDAGDVAADREGEHDQVGVERPGRAPQQADLVLRVPAGQAEQQDFGRGRRRGQPSLGRFLGAAQEVPAHRHGAVHERVADAEHPPRAGALEQVPLAIAKAEAVDVAVVVLGKTAGRAGAQAVAGPGVGHVGRARGRRDGRLVVPDGQLAAEQAEGGQRRQERGADEPPRGRAVPSPGGHGRLRSSARPWASRCSRRRGGGRRPP